VNTERWKLVDDLLQSALQLAPERRDEFLQKACSGDAALIAEVYVNHIPSVAYAISACGKLHHAVCLGIGVSARDRGPVARRARNATPMPLAPISWTPVTAQGLTDHNRASPTVRAHILS
jgi:hypothetical protein